MNTIIHSKIIKVCKPLIYSVCLTLLYSCSSLELPSIDESTKKISLYKEKLNEINKLINSKNNTKPSDKELTILINKEIINAIFSTLSKSTKEDIQIIFRKTKNVIKDDIKVLGIEYTNYVNIDSGNVKLNLKSIKLINLNNDKIATTIEIEGNGNIYINAKHTGISASVKSGIELNLKDTIEFKVESSKGNEIIITPIPKKINLKTKFSIEILKWNVPWRENIELELTDIISPIKIPMNISTEINLPYPKQNNKAGEFDFNQYLLEFSNSKVSILNEKLTWQANFNIINKK